MNPEKRPGEENFLDNKDAQEEANMIRAKMGQNPETGKIEGERVKSPDMTWNGEFPELAIDRKPTADDYDKALQIIEDMKKLAAEQDPNSKDINKLLRAINKTYEQITFWVGE